MVIPWLAVQYSYIEPADAIVPSGTAVFPAWLDVPAMICVIYV